MIGAVILAAGESRRMGRQKLLLPFGETTVIGAVVRTVLAAAVDRAAVVLGADAGAVRAALAPWAGPGPGPGPGRVVFVVNEDYPLGMLTSIQAGIRALPAGTEAAVVVLGDQPFLAPAVIAALIAAYRETNKGLVLPTCRGRRGHPVLIDLKYRDEVLAIGPAEGLRRLLLAHPGDILEREVADANILRDLDTPEDYAGLAKPN